MINTQTELRDVVSRSRQRSKNKWNAKCCYYCGGFKDAMDHTACKCTKKNKVCQYEAACQEHGTTNVADLKVGDIICVSTPQGWFPGWRVTEVTDGETHVCCEQTLATMGQGMVTKTKTFHNVVTTYIYRPVRAEGVWIWWWDV